MATKSSRNRLLLTNKQEPLAAAVTCLYWFKFGTIGYILFFIFLNYLPPYPKAHFVPINVIPNIT